MSDGGARQGQSYDLQLVHAEPAQDGSGRFTAARALLQDSTCGGIHAVGLVE
ncbi:hypothetical protein [Paracoccus tibetensis]|uniref:hypothetical protein n=1 Tax=Paracoccus tibetensis TaxID=336292 RepID=UPI001FDFF3A9|nr:hypothetical protein [Paracoccus tibetensis]